MRPPLLALLLPPLLLAAAVAAAAEVATFNRTHSVSLTFNTTSDRRVSVLWLLARSSHAENGSQLLRLEANNSSSLVVAMATNGSLVASVDGEQPAEVVVADGADDGEWLLVSVRLHNASRSRVCANTSTNTTCASFPPDLTFDLGASRLVLGDGWRGCLANATLNATLNATMAESESEEELEEEEELALPLYGGSQLRQPPLVMDGRPPNDAGCHEDPCPCANGATCQESSQWNVAGNCSCVRDFIGRLCQLLGPCRNGDPQQPCRNGGNCSQAGDPLIPETISYACACAPGYAGVNCTTKLDEGGGGIGAGGVVGIVAGVLLVLVLLLLLLVGLRRLKERRQGTGVYRPSDREFVAASGLAMEPVLAPPNEERLI